tara:strand:+ start:619 stop:1098 length:480 start_codon:yes stop_codon:yes gene_type:complete
MWLKKTSSGIGFIEVMTAVVIISIAALGILMGAVHARGQLHALQVKERATEELLNYMEYWKGRIADGVLSSSEWAGDLQGDQIYLYGNAQSDYKIKANLYYDIERLQGSTQYGPTDFKRYRLDCWIKWKDYLQSPANRWSNRVEKERKLSTVMAVFDIE